MIAPSAIAHQQIAEVVLTGRKMFIKESHFRQVAAVTAAAERARRISSGYRRTARVSLHVDQNISRRKGKCAGDVIEYEQCEAKSRASMSNIYVARTRHDARVPGYVLAIKTDAVNKQHAA